MSRDLYRIYWDYYGPHAEKTAQHFHHHLDEMIEREGVTASVTATGVEAYTPLHSAAWCEADFEVAKQLAQSLKAKRASRSET